MHRARLVSKPSQRFAQNVPCWEASTELEKLTGGAIPRNNIAYALISVQQQACLLGANRVAVVALYSKRMKAKDFFVLVAACAAGQAPYTAISRTALRDPTLLGNNVSLTTGYVNLYDIRAHEDVLALLRPRDNAVYQIYTPPSYAPPKGRDTAQAVPEPKVPLRSAPKPQIRPFNPFR